MLRFSYHFAFWGAFTLLFLYQTPNANTQDYVSWVFTMVHTGCVVYINTLVLLPRFLFQKKYLQYSLALCVLILLGAVSFPLSIPEETNIVQNMVNLLFFIVITSSLKFFREFLHKEEKLIKTENQQLKTELALLKSQVNPHFLFNTLNNLYGLILAKDIQKAAEVALKLSDLMRYILESSKSDKVSLKKEVKFLEYYLDLEKIRLSQQADIRLEIFGLQQNDVLVAPLLFISFVENVFKHGLQAISEQNFAHFSLALQGDEIYFEAQNSMNINTFASNQKKSGTGLINLRKRLELMYPNKHFLEIEAQDGIFKVSLQLKVT